MKKVIILVLVFLLSGCAAVPFHKVTETCNLLNTAVMESGNLSFSWYMAAGKVLKECGLENGETRSLFFACFAAVKDNPGLDCMDPEAVESLKNK